MASSRTRLLDAALHLVRAKGYGATTVDDLCAAAGVSKGSFFHHFKSKEDLGRAAARHFGEFAENAFAKAPYRSAADPLDRLLGYIDFRQSILQGTLADYTCFLGTMVQETYETHPALRQACEAEIIGHALTLAPDIAAAKALYAPEENFTPESLACHIQAVLQGAFILAKAKGGPEIAAETLNHLRRYLELLFNRP